MTRANFFSKVLKPVSFILMLGPLVWLIWRGLENNLGANPVETLTHETGLWALRFLMLTLALTPLKKITGWGEFIRLRRMTGLYSFVYACLHLATYLWLDQGFSWTHILEDIAERPYITVGFAAFILLVPLAATSFDKAIRFMGGKRWKKLHRLVYLCGLGSVIHYLWLVKADLLNPMIYAVIFSLLMIFRVKIPASTSKLLSPVSK